MKMIFYFIFIIILPHTICLTKLWNKTEALARKLPIYTININNKENIIYYDESKKKKNQKKWKLGTSTKEDSNVCLTWFQPPLFRCFKLF